MTFGSDHYVPVLKVKRAEKAALKSILSSQRTRITPLLEIVERKDKPLEEHLNTSFKDLAECCGHYGRCFLDVREIAPDGPAGALQVFARATTAHIAFAPVTGVSRTADVAAALHHRTHGLGLRLTRGEFEQGNLPAKLSAFLATHALVASDI